MIEANTLSLEILNFLIESGFYLGTFWLKDFDSTDSVYYQTNFINKVNKANGKHQILNYKLQTTKGKIESTKHILCFLVP